jgi:hypothetical protein
VGHVTNCDLAYAFVNMYLGADTVGSFFRFELPLNCVFKIDVCAKSTS